MKKLLLLPIILLSVPAMADADNVHLVCRTNITTTPSTDPNVKESYDVKIMFLDDGAILTVDGTEYNLKQQYDDARVAYYSMEPWFNLQIGNRDYPTKYTLGIPTNENFARYTSCEEID